MLYLLGLAIFPQAGAVSDRNASAVAPHWGCGLLGPIPGISPDGSTTANAQKMIDGLKVTSSFGKTSYWNWDLAPQQNDDGTSQWLSEDFIFMPEEWGVQAPNASYVRPAGQKGFLDSNGQYSPATMATIFLGANEPDIYGSCMGNMFGRCTAPCTAAEEQVGCPAAKLNGGDAQPLANGHCNCWQYSHATGCGYWGVGTCANPQPLPTLFDDNECVGDIMGMWRDTAKIVASKGYQYLATPLVAVDLDWVKSFVKAACTNCNHVSCGCPTHIGWHFYASDCQPATNGGYDDFQSKLDQTKQIMEEFPNILGAIVNEVGMLNCAGGGDVICIPNGPKQKYPAINQPNHACPSTDQLPNGLGSFIDGLMDRVIATTTDDGRPVVSSFSWFNENMNGGTYNLQLFDESGAVNAVGEAYIAACQRWSDSLSL